MSIEKFLSNVVVDGTISKVGGTSSQFLKADGSVDSNVYATLASPTFTGTVSGITKTMVGLGNVDNTSDANKPVSTAQQTALDSKAPISGSANYIQNQQTSAQSANMWISGDVNARAGAFSSLTISGYSDTSSATIYGKNKNSGISSTDNGNLQLYTVDNQGIGIGAGIALGGRYTDSGVYSNFAKIYGKKENAISGSFSGRLVFETSNNTTDPYSREVGSFSSDGVLKINNLSGTGDRVLSVDSIGNLLISTAPTAPTAAPGTNNTQIATTAFVQANTTARPYKVYTALLSQTGTNAPEAIVLENTLGGTIVWTRTGTGAYLGTLAGMFPDVNKAFCVISLGKVMSSYGDNINLFYQVNNNGIGLTTIKTNINKDDVLAGNPIEIRVYN